MRFTNEFRIRVIGYRCVYCGDNANTDDHYPPASVSMHGLLFPCCSECNSSLGAQHPYSFSNRCKMAKDYIRRKYKKVLKMPHWDDEEMEGLSHSIRSDIESCARVKLIINERLAWNAMSYLSGLDQGRDFAAIIAECDLIIGNVKKYWTRTDGFNDLSEDKDAKKFIEEFG